MGRKKFNMDPKKVRCETNKPCICPSVEDCWRTAWWIVTVFQGIVFLVENELLRNTPEDIAQFLYKGEGLNKTAIGDYLGERYLTSICS